MKNPNNNATNKLVYLKGATKAISPFRIANTEKRYPPAKKVEAATRLRESNIETFTQLTVNDPSQLNINTVTAVVVATKKEETSLERRRVTISRMVTNITAKRA